MLNDKRFLIVGLGYVGTQVARQAVAAGSKVFATTRQPGRTAVIPGVEVCPFADPAPFRLATHLIITAAPGPDGDPVWAAHAGVLHEAQALRWVGYVSTTGVYGDRKGDWVDELTPPAPSQDRSRRRLAAEQQWVSLEGRVSVALLRTGGIYGPGRSAIDDLAAGAVRSVAKPGHAFSRIHRDDIARAVIAASRRDSQPRTTVLHLVDDEPAEPAAVNAYAARLLDAPAPSAIPFEDAVASMSDMARSFWSENRRVSNLKTKAHLGLDWAYPTFREGLRAILADKRAQHAAKQGEVRRR